MGAVEILNLTQAFDDKQSEAIARFFDANAAAKKDIEAVRLEIEKVRADLKSDIEAVRADLKSNIEAVRTDVEKLRLEVQRDLEAVRKDLAEKMLRYQVAGVISLAIIFGGFRYLVG